MTDDDQNQERELEALFARLPSPEPPSRNLQSQLRLRVLNEYDRVSNSAGAELFWRRATNVGGLIMSHPLSSVVATAAAVVLVAIWWAVPQSSIAFADLLAPIVDARSAKYKMTATMDVKGMNTSGTGYFLAPRRVRQEIAEPTKLISIADFDQGRMLSLMPEKKEALLIELKGRPADIKHANNVFDDTREMLARYRKDGKGHLEELGEKQIESHRAIGFRIATTGSVQTIWGDADTGTILRIESLYAGPPKVEVVMSDFEFDVALDESLFSTEPPADYKSFSVPIEATPPTEADFLASMRRLSDALDGRFPTGLDLPGVGSAMAKLLKDRDTQEMMTEGVTLSRGLQFVALLPPDSDPYYAGKEAKRAGPRTPIFWYKPAGSEKFRVLWSDLTASDAESAPEVPGAVRIVEQFTKPNAK